MTSDRRQVEQLNSDLYAGTLITFFEHGTLVFEGAKSGTIHSDWDFHSSLFSLAGNSIRIAVVADVDGPVRVDSFYDDPPEEFLSGLIQCYDAEIDTADFSCRVFDSDEIASLRIPVSAPRQRVKVYATDGDFIRHVVFILSDV